MKFTELSAYSLPAGTVTEWTPDVGPDPSPWYADDRPLTYNHELHSLRAAFDPASMSRSSWLGVVFEMKCRFDASVLEATLRDWNERHEAFRTTIDVISERNESRAVRRTHRPDALTIKATERGSFSSGAEVEAHLDRTFSTRLSPLQWPHCIVATISEIPECQDNFLIAFAADHSVIDAYSMLLSVDELRTLYEARMRNTAPELPPVGSYVDFAVAERAAGRELTYQHPAVETWRRFLSANDGKLPSFGLPVMRPRLENARSSEIGAQSGWSEFVISGADAERLNAQTRAAGHSMQTAVIGAFALANRMLTGESRFRAVMPMHTRHEARYQSSIGWYVGLGPLEVDVEDTANLADSLTPAATGIATAKELSRFPYPRIADLLESDTAPEFVVSYLDLRFVPGEPDWAANRAQTLRGGLHSDSEVYIWVARVRSGITISVRYPSGDLAHFNVGRFLAAVTAILSRASDRIDIRVDESVTHAECTTLVEQTASESDADQRRPA